MKSKKVNSLFITTSFCMIFAGTAFSQVNTIITDGDNAFAEGVLEGYEVQVAGSTICIDPVVFGRYIICNERSKGKVWVDGSGVLGAYVIVIDGIEICENPSAFNNFRGLGNFIICE